MGQKVQRPTSALIAILEMPRSSIVTGTDDAMLSDQNTADPAFHAIAALGSERSQLHKVLVPVGP